MNRKVIKINGNDTDYIIYENGSVYSIKTKKFLSPRQSENDDNYLTIVLYVNGKAYQRYIHRLVAEAFIPNPDNKPEVNHKDGDKTNPDISNLEWVTKSENIIHAFKTGLKQGKRGKTSHFAKYDSDRIELACQLLSEGILTLKMIEDITEIPFATLYSIIYFNAWEDISKKYNVKNYYHDRDSYTSEMYEIVFKLLSDNRLSLYEISDISGIRYSSINNILRNVPNPLYNNLYKKYDITKYSSKNKTYKDIPEEAKEKIKRMFFEGIKSKYIKRIISKEFDINEEKIRVYIRDHVK